MLQSIPPNFCVLSVMRYLNGKSSLMIFDRVTNLKYRCGRDFWCQGVDTVGWNKTAVELYIRIPPEEDKASEPLERKELFSLSVVEPVVIIILFVVDPKMVCCKIYF